MRIASRPRSTGLNARPLAATFHSTTKLQAPRLPTFHARSRLHGHAERVGSLVGLPVCQEQLGNAHQHTRRALLWLELQKPLRGRQSALQQHMVRQRRRVVLTLALLLRLRWPLAVAAQQPQAQQAQRRYLQDDAPRPLQLLEGERDGQPCLPLLLLQPGGEVPQRRAFVDAAAVLC